MLALPQTLWYLLATLKWRVFWNRFHLLSRPPSGDTSNSYNRNIINVSRVKSWYISPCWIELSAPRGRCVGGVNGSTPSHLHSACIIHIEIKYNRYLPWKETIHVEHNMSLLRIPSGQIGDKPAGYLQAWPRIWIELPYKVFPSEWNSNVDSRTINKSVILCTLQFSHIPHFSARDVLLLGQLKLYFIFR